MIERMESNILFEEQIVKQLKHVAEMPDSEARDLEISNLKVLMAMKRDSDEIEMKRLDLENKKAEIENNNAYRNKQLAIDEAYQNKQLAIEEAKLKEQRLGTLFNAIGNIAGGLGSIGNVMVKAGYTNAMFKAEYKDDKIISSKTAGLLGH